MVGEQEPDLVNEIDLEVGRETSAEDLLHLHCGSSKREGALLALRAARNGASDAEALEIGRRAGLSSLEPTVRQALGEK